MKVEKTVKNDSDFIAMVTVIIVDIIILKNTSYTFDLLMFDRECSNDTLI